MKAKYIFVLMLLTTALLIVTIFLYIKYPTNIEDETLIFNLETTNYINKEKYSRTQEYFIITDLEVEYYRTITYNDNTALTYKKDIDIIDNKFTINNKEYTLNKNKLCLEDNCFISDKIDNYISYEDNIIKTNNINKIINNDITIIYVYDKYEDLSNIVKDYDIKLYTISIKNIKDKSIKPNTILIYNNKELQDTINPNELHEYLFNNNFLFR